MSWLLPLAAAHTTALEKLQKIPPAFWLKLGIAVLVVAGTVILMRMFARANKMILSIVGVVVLSFVGFSWIYERNEPSWATPVVEKLAGFFPSKTTYPGK